MTYHHGASQPGLTNMNISEELKKELSNAIVAYSKILRKADLGISTPGFEDLLECLPSELQHKMQLLKAFMNNYN